MAGSDFILELLWKKVHLADFLCCQLPSSSESPNPFLYCAVPSSLFSIYYISFLIKKFCYYLKTFSCHICMAMAMAIVTNH